MVRAVVILPFAAGLPALGTLQPGIIHAEANLPGVLHLLWLWGPHRPLGLGIVDMLPDTPTAHITEVHRQPLLSCRC